MKILCVKSQNDNKKFKIFQKIGIKVLTVSEPESIDVSLEKLVEQQYDTILISNEIASFSEDIIKKYNKKQTVKIIIV